jgi:hypothetical protein
MHSRPESIAQGLLAVFARGALAGKGLVLRELLSGIGFVDVGIVLSTVLHLVEIKILAGVFKGAKQLQRYMRCEKRKEGWLIIIEVRPAERRTPIPKLIHTPDGVVRSIVIDANPEAPSLVR